MLGYGVEWRHVGCVGPRATSTQALVLARVTELELPVTSPDDVSNRPSLETDPGTVG